MTEIQQEQPHRYQRLGENVDVVKAFLKAQKEFSVALKENSNPVFRAKYADINNVLDAILPALFANGLGISQIPNTDTVVDGYVRVKTLLLHESGVVTELSDVRVNVTKGDAQGSISAATYGRRLGLTGPLGIKTTDDDDGNAASGSPTEMAAGYEEELAKVVSEVRSAAYDKIRGVQAAAVKKYSQDKLASARLLKAYNERVDELKAEKAKAEAATKA